MLKFISRIDLKDFIKMSFFSNNNLKRLSVLFFYFFILFISSYYIFGDNFNSDSKLKKKSLVYITYQDKIAKAMCFYDKYYIMNLVYFKGPSGILIKAGTYRNDNIVADINYYEYIDSNGKKYQIKYGISHIHSVQGFGIPAMVNINGTTINDFINVNDGGISEKRIHEKIKKEFQLLPSKFKLGLRELYLFCGQSLRDINIITVYLGSIFKGVIPYKSDVDIVSENEVDTIQNFLSEINYCPSEGKFSINHKTKKHNFSKLFKINIEDRVSTVLYNRENNMEKILFKNSNDIKIKIYISRNKFPGNFIKFEYKEKKITYIIEQFVFSHFTKNTNGIPIVYGFNGYYIAGILDNKKNESLYKIKIKKEIQNLPINLQKGLKEFWEYYISSLCKKEVINCNYNKFFFLPNKKHTSSMVKAIDSETLKKKLINEFKKYNKKNE